MRRAVRLKWRRARLAASRQTTDMIASLYGLLLVCGERDDGDLSGFIERGLAFHKGGSRRVARHSRRQLSLTEGQQEGLDGVFRDASDFCI